MPILNKMFKVRSWVFAAIGILLLSVRGSAQVAVTPNWQYNPIYGVQAIAYSPNGQWLAIGGTGGIQIYDRATLQLLRCLPSASTAVNSLAFMKQGPELAVGGNVYDTNINPVLELWNVSTGKLIASLPAHDSGYPAVGSVAFTPDESMLVSAGTGPVECWDTRTGKLVRSIKANGTPVNGVAISPDGKTLATAEATWNVTGQDTLELWNLTTGVRISALPSAAAQNNGVAFSPDGTKLVSCGMYEVLFADTYSDVLEEWSVSNHKLLATLENGPTADLTAVSFSPDGLTLVAAGYTNPPNFQNTSLIEIWDAASGKKTNTLGGLGKQIVATAFSPDGKTLVTGGYPKDFQLQDAPDVCELWNVATGTLLQNKVTASYGYLGASSFAYSPDSKLIAQGAPGALYQSSTGGYGSVVILRNAVSGAVNATFDSAAVQGVGAVAFSPNGSILADGGFNNSGSGGTAVGVLELWDPTTKKPLASLASLCSNGMNQLDFSPDGTLLAAAGSIFDRQIDENVGVLELWNVAMRKVTGYAIGKVNLQIVGVAFTADNKTMVDGGYSYVKNANAVVALEIWNLVTGKVAFELPTSLTTITATALSPDGKTFLASGSVGSTPLTEFWNVASGKLLTTLSDSGTALQYSPDGSVLWINDNSVLKAYGVTSNVVLGAYAVQATLANQFLVSHDTTSIAFLGFAPNVGVIPNPLFEESVSGISLSPSSVLGSAPAVATVTLSHPAPAGGTAVYVGSSAPAALPVTIQIPAGKSSGTAVIATVPVSVPTPVTLTARNVGSPRTATLVVNPASLSSLKLSTQSVVGGSNTAVTGLVTMTGPAPAGGYKVVLSSSSADATVEASVLVPAGANHASFPIKTVAVKSSTTVTLSASFNKVTESAKLTVTP